MNILLTILIVPGILCTYFIFIRPALHAVPAFKQFYDEADGFWAKVWAVCGKSITMLWGYVLAGIGFLMQAIEPIATMFGDPDIKQQVTDALGANPKILGYVLMAISALTLAARLRSITKAD